MFAFAGPLPFSLRCLSYAEREQRRCALFAYLYQTVTLHILPFPRPVLKVIRLRNNAPQRIVGVPPDHMPQMGMRGELLH